MEDILELILTVTLEVISGLKFKKQSTRRRVMTAFFSVLATALDGFLIWTTVSTALRGEIVGAAVLGIITLCLIVISVAVVLRGHKNDWEQY